MMLVEVINAQKPVVLWAFCGCYRCPQRV